jgi:addiction module RelE/StbE family toxin
MKKPEERRVKFAVSPAYAASWKKYSRKSPIIRSKLTEFNNAKRHIPPTRLPKAMKDHVLDGSLSGVRECHLYDNVLLLYTHKDDLITLLLVCEHADLKGPKAKALAKLLNQYGM